MNHINCVCFLHQYLFFFFFLLCACLYFKHRNKTFINWTKKSPQTPLRFFLRFFLFSHVVRWKSFEAYLSFFFFYLWISLSPYLFQRESEINKKEYRELGIYLKIQKLEFKDSERNLTFINHFFFIFFQLFFPFSFSI